MEIINVSWLKEEEKNNLFKVALELLRKSKLCSTLRNRRPTSEQNFYIKIVAAQLFTRDLLESKSIDELSQKINSYEEITLDMILSYHRDEKFKTLCSKVLYDSLVKNEMLIERKIKATQQGRDVESHRIFCGFSKVITLLHNKDWKTWDNSDLKIVRFVLYSLEFPNKCIHHTDQEATYISDDSDESMQSTDKLAHNTYTSPFFLRSLTSLPPPMPHHPELKSQLLDIHPLNNSPPPSNEHYYEEEHSLESCPRQSTKSKIVSSETKQSFPISSTEAVESHPNEFNSLHKHSLKRGHLANCLFSQHHQSTSSNELFAKTTPHSPTPETETESSKKRKNDMPPPIEKKRRHIDSSFLVPNSNPVNFLDHARNAIISRDFKKLQELIQSHPSLSQLEKITLLHTSSQCLKRDYELLDYLTSLQ